MDMLIRHKRLHGLKRFGKGEPTMQELVTQMVVERKKLESEGTNKEEIAESVFRETWSGKTSQVAQFQNN